MNKSIKKRILMFLASVGVVIALPLGALAQSATTFVTGTVTYNGADVGGAHVTVTCNGHVRHATSNSRGAYLVQYTAKQCPSGVNATATASKNKKGSGHSSGKVIADSALLNVAIANVSLPELGLLTGIGAAIVGGGAFLAIRRRELGGNKH